MSQPFSISAVVARPASGPGALDGFESRCSCGLVLRSSLRTLLETDRREHAAYHARKLGGRALTARGVDGLLVVAPAPGLMLSADGTIIGEKSMSDREFLAPLLGAPRWIFEVVDADGEVVGQAPGSSPADALETFNRDALAGLGVRDVVAGEPTLRFEGEMFGACATDRTVV